MVASIPTTEPSELLAGDTARWRITLADYPASAGWVLTYTLANASNLITFVAGASGADHLIDVPAATTAVWTPGAYTWRSQATLDTDVFTLGTGTMVVRPSFAVAVDSRSHARRVLEIVEAYLEDKQNLTAARYMIAGRELFRIPMAELLTLRSRYLIEVASEDAAAAVSRGLPDKRRVFVRF
jgi:hypothetical protein